MAVTAEQLAKLHIGAEWVSALNETFDRFGISSALQQAAFIGQCGHECGHFKILEENLNYRAETLMKLWPKRFPTKEIADQYARQPRKIANKVYADRMGNRDEASGDGFVFGVAVASSLLDTQTTFTLARHLAWISWVILTLLLLHNMRR